MTAVAGEVAQLRGEGIEARHPARNIDIGRQLVLKHKNAMIYVRLTLKNQQ